MQENSPCVGSCSEVGLFGIKIQISSIEDYMDLIAIAAFTNTVLLPERCKNMDDEQKKHHQEALELVAEHLMNIFVRHAEKVIEETEALMKQYQTPLPMIDQLIYEREGIVKLFQESGHDCQFLIDFLEVLAITREKGFISPEPFCPFSKKSIFS